MDDFKIIKWLLEGDISIQYQVYRDLIGVDKKNLQEKISKEGWGKEILNKRNKNGHWGDRFYQPKWISTHYTLLDLRNLNISPTNKTIQQSINLVLDSEKSKDGGICLGPSTSAYSDVCVNGMFLNYASYFLTDEEKLKSIIDSILKELMPDGGFNCRSTRSGATHSSLHSTISVLEGLFEFINTGYKYRKEEIIKAKKSAEEFILIHKLFLSDHTGAIISKDFLKFPYPSRWKYDILRAMDYFQNAKTPRDERMNNAIDIILSKRHKDGYWKIQSAHPGQTHFDMEKAGKPSRWNTLRAIRILKYYNKLIINNYSHKKSELN